MLFVLLCMPCLPKNNVLKVILPCGRYQTSTFYGWNIVHSTYTRFINLLSHWRTLVLSSLLAVVNSVHVNMGVWAEFHIYLTDMAVSWACVCVTFREITRCFHSQCSISYSYQQCTSVPVSPYFLQYLPFLECTHPSRCEVVSVVFISSSAMANDAEHLFRYLLAVCMSLEKCPFSSPCTFMYGVGFVVHLGVVFYTSEYWILFSVRLASIFHQSAVLSGCCCPWGAVL